MRDDPLVDEEGYPSYNKPYSLMAWLEAEDIAEDYIMMLDGDMLMREPIDPVALGAARGRVVSAEYTYLVGTEPGRGFAERFIATKLVQRLAQVRGWPSRRPQRCPSGPLPHLNYHPLPTAHYLLPTQVGGFHIFHKEDLRKIAPLWLEYTKQVHYASAHTGSATLCTMHAPCTMHA